MDYAPSDQYCKVDENHPMKTLHGITVNLPVSVIGVVTNSVTRIEGYILAPGELACSVGLSKESVGQPGGPYIHSISRLSELEDKDVVLVKPDGSMTVLYDYQGNDNAIFVTDRCQTADRVADSHHENDISATSNVRSICLSKPAVRISGGANGT